MISRLSSLLPRPLGGKVVRPATVDASQSPLPGARLDEAVRIHFDPVFGSAPFQAGARPAAEQDRFRDPVLAALGLACRVYSGTVLVVGLVWLSLPGVNPKEFHDS